MSDELHDLTAVTVLHLNRGRYGDVIREVYADGQPTGITISTTTDKKGGAYRIERKTVCAGPNEELDVLANPGTSVIKWIRERVPAGLEANKERAVAQAARNAERATPGVEAEQTIGGSGAST